MKVGIYERTTGMTDRRCRACGKPASAHTAAYGSVEECEARRELLLAEGGGVYKRKRSKRDSIILERGYVQWKRKKTAKQK